jgi:hypothetical protein
MTCEQFAEILTCTRLASDTELMAGGKHIHGCEKCYALTARTVYRGFDTKEAKERIKKIAMELSRRIREKMRSDPEA